MILLSLGDRKLTNWWRNIPISDPKAGKLHDKPGDVAKTSNDFILYSCHFKWTDRAFPIRMCVDLLSLSLLKTLRQLCRCVPSVAFGCWRAFCVAAAHTQGIQHWRDQSIETVNEYLYCVVGLWNVLLLWTCRKRPGTGIAWWRASRKRWRDYSSLQL